MKMVDQSIHTETFPSLKFGKKALESIFAGNAPVLKVCSGKLRI